MFESRFEEYHMLPFITKYIDISSVSNNNGSYTYSFSLIFNNKHHLLNENTIDISCIKTRLLRIILPKCHARFYLLYYMHYIYLYDRFDIFETIL